MYDSDTPAGFRPDLRLYPGPRDFDGSPTYNLHDPVTDRYFKFSWPEGVVFNLAKPGMSIDEILAAVHQHTTLRLSATDLQNFFGQAAGLGLLQLPTATETVLKKYKANQSHPVWWLIKNYLFFRVPLVKPDAFLTATLPYVKLLWSTPAIIVYLIAATIGVSAMLIQWDAYVNTFMQFFNLQGAIAYALAITTVKVIHELSHAYTAKNYKVYVPTMGIAFIVLWPVLYTDVTSGWKLPQRKQRLAITIAGVAAELVIAGLALLGWSLSSPGIWQSVFFLLSSVSLLGSLLINTNPAMRFDGYYLLCDLWQFDNLRARAFAVGRWQLHRWLFGLELPHPEGHLSVKKTRLLCFYAFFTYIYLFIVYVAIALLVYHLFTKALGIVLFLVEIAVFFVWPVLWEANVLYRLRNHLTWNKHSITTAICSALLFLWFVIPLPHTMTFQAITASSNSQQVWIPRSGTIVSIPVRRNDPISAGQLLLQLEDPQLEAELAKAKADVLELSAASNRLRYGQDQHSMLAAQLAAKAAASSLVERLQYELEMLSVRATVSGTLYAWDDTLKPGQPISNNQAIGKVADLSKLEVVAFVPETEVHNLAVGQSTEFLLPTSSRRFKGTLTQIDPVSTPFLNYPALGSLFHGPLTVTPDAEKRLVLTQSYFQVRVQLTTPQLPLDKVGILEVRGKPQSLLIRLINFLAGIFTQESSL